MALLEVRDASKAFGEGATRQQVLNRVNLSVEEGEFVMLVGRSGAGKSTLLNLLAGLLLPDGGSVHLAGAPVTGPGTDRGVVFQHHGLLPWLTAYANVRLAVDAVFPQWTAARRDTQTRETLALVHLEHATEKLPHQLSGGMRQRVAVARALAMDPKILLLDEPFSALDALTRGTLQEELERIRQSTGKTILMVTNDLDEALLLGDRVIPFGNDGTLLEPVTVHLAHPRARLTIVHEPEFRALRTQLTARLMSAGAGAAVQPETAPLPEVLPDHLLEHRARQARHALPTVSLSQEPAS
jgi:nitrate/nitrite transport system ATP-binding protein